MNPKGESGRREQAVEGLPAGLDHVRTTAVFDEHTTPAGLRRAHRIAEGVWGRLVIRSGALTFVVEGGSTSRRVTAGEHVVIPPLVAHHVEVDDPVEFEVEFHR